MQEFVVALLDLAFFPFQHTDNLIIFIPTFVMYWCAGWSILRSLFHHCRL